MTDIPIHSNDSMRPQYHVGTAGKYGPQLYIERPDGQFRYPLDDLVTSLDRHLLNHPAPAEYVANRAALANEAKLRHAAEKELADATRQREEMAALLRRASAMISACNGWRMESAEALVIEIDAALANNKATT